MTLYLDHNASSPARPQVIEAVQSALLTPGNPSAPHAMGRSANQCVTQGRESVAGLAGVCSQDLIFTGSGTEGVNTAIHSALKSGCRRLLISSMDHPASIKMAEASGAIVELIPASKSGLLDIDWVSNRLRDWETKDGQPFIAVAAANSETGVLQDVARLSEMANAHHALLLVDAVQVLGKMPIDFQADYLAISAHKIGGPQGVGALYVSADAPFSPYLIGGGQEKRRRAGTLNVAGIAGFGAAAIASAPGLEHLRPWRDAMERELTAMEPDLTIFGRDTNRLPNTSFFAVPDMAASTLMMGLDLEGVCVSTGLACSSGKVGASRAITAMGLSELAPQGAIRVSLGYTTQAHDIDRFLSAWTKVRTAAHRREFKDAG